MLSTLDQLATEIPRAMLADRFRFRRKLQALRRARKAGKPFGRSLSRLNQQLDKSIELRARRQRHVPEVSYPEDLPITAHREQIARAIDEHQVIIVCGETGSGKSTQLPKICLDVGRGVEGMIGHTQPRRIAARSVAARLAEELACPLGTHVGYRVRFQDQTKPETHVKLMTDGILLAETQHDRWLNAYDTIIIDEAHERSLNIDFLLGYLKRLLNRRTDLRVIVTSATIDPERLAGHFSIGDRPAPVIEVSGRTYPVEVRYRPPAQQSGNDEPDLARLVADAAQEAAAEGPGDMLVFLPTERDIRDAAKVLRGRTVPGGEAEIVPLYARLSAAEQNKVFRAHPGRRIVLATNVAESSLTVPGIRFVVDTGTARISRYAPRSKVQRLPIEPVSQASADQRAGRCGRVGPGICLRLYSEDDYLSRDQYATPEIRRTNLASVILQTLALDLGDVESFPFVDRPRPDAVREGYKTLFELGAVDERRRLTDIGRRLARLPVDPRIARMILAGAEQGCLSEVLIIASALEVQDPRERPSDQRAAAAERHREWVVPRSDFLSYLKLWDLFHELKQQCSRSQLRKACREHFLSLARMREWQEVHRQLRDLTRQASLAPGARGDDYEAIHKALLAGMLSGIAMRDGTFEYRGVGEQRFYLWPGSGPFGRKPKWVMASELVETNKRYLRTVAQIQPEWIEPLAGHLVKRHYKAPHWSRQRGTVMAYERITLFGLTILRSRPVRYGPIAPAEARELFIRHALIEDDVQTDMELMVHNRRLLEEVSSLAARTRRREYLLDEATLFSFFDERLPADVYDLASLRLWLRRSQRNDQSVLMMQHSDLLPKGASLDRREFPERIHLNEQQLRLQYRYQLGTANDGVTVEVPEELLGQVDADQLDWLVPGLLVEKIVSLIRLLPKSIRQRLVPAPDTAQRVAAEVEFGEGPFLPTIAEALSRAAGEPIDAESFDLAGLPDHLRMNIRVVGPQGETVAEGRDLASLRDELGVRSLLSTGEIRDAGWMRDGIQSWDFGELPRRVEVGRGTFTLAGYPTLIDRNDSVSLRLVTTEDRARAALRDAVRRLFCLAHHRLLKSQVDWLPKLKRLGMLALPLEQGSDLREDLIELVAERSLFGESEPPLPRDAAQWQALSHRGEQRLGIAVQEVAALSNPLLEAYHEARTALRNPPSTAAEETLADVQSQFDALTAARFWVRTPWPWLEQYPRYFRAIVLRLDKIRSGGAARDRQRLAEFAPLAEQYHRRHQRHVHQGRLDPELNHYRWMLEELRVSLFAQELGTAIKVSPQRLMRQWEKVPG